MIVIDIHGFGDMQDEKINNIKDELLKALKEKFPEKVENDEIILCFSKNRCFDSQGQSILMAKILVKNNDLAMEVQKKIGKTLASNKIFKVFYQ